MADLDRDNIVSSIQNTVPALAAAGVKLDMAGIVAGGLQFLVTGEDGTRLSDSDLLDMAHHEDGLASMLFCDLEAAWQGLQGDDRKRAWKVCNAIATAFCKAVS